MGIALLSLSYCNGLVRVGTAVLLLHDPADIALQSGKLFRLLNWQLLTNVVFAVLVVAWFATRIVVFPYHCVLSGFIYFKNENDSTVILVCCVLMCALYVLHLHWFWLILQAVIRAIKGKGVNDSRSDDESDDEDTTNKNSECEAYDGESMS